MNQQAAKGTPVSGASFGTVKQPPPGTPGTAQAAPAQPAAPPPPVPSPNPAGNTRSLTKSGNSGSDKGSVHRGAYFGGAAFRDGRFRRRAVAEIYRRSLAKQLAGHSTVVF